MRIGIAQINAFLGDFSGNRRKILSFVRRAKARRCDIVVFPELALFGYYPGDLLERQEIVQNQLKELKKLSSSIPEDVAVLIGAITDNTRKRGRVYHNSAILLRQGHEPKFFHKELLPVYDVFDESRHIEPGKIEDNHFTWKKKKVLVTICEDIWAWDQPTTTAAYAHNPLHRVKDTPWDVVLNLSGSPFYLEKHKKRQWIVRKTARLFQAPVVYVNLVGAQDELIYDGGSFVMDHKGRVVAQGLFFEEDLFIYDLDENQGEIRPHKFTSGDRLHRALVTGLRDFVEKTGFKRVHLGLSGGIDSAVVACLAVDALGADAVTCIGLPGPFNAPESLEIARKLAGILGTQWHEIPISKAYEATLETYHAAMGEQDFGIVQENMQARLRGLLLMAYSNSHQSLLLNTSNKVELAVGYSTLYGDMCGGLAPIGDLLKSQVYELANYYNQTSEVIPSYIIERPPSAELSPNQKDEDTLLPYDELNKAVRNIVEKYRKPRGAAERWVFERLIATEFKRWQAPPILRVSEHAFGRGRRLPIAHR